MTSQRIVFLGTPDISAECLKGLVEAGFNIVACITKEDKVRLRNNKVDESAVAKAAKEYSIPVFKPHKLNIEHDFLYDLKPDLLLTFAYGQLINDEILALGKYKPLNLHASLLPKYRGAAPIQYALRNGDSETGVSLMEMVHKMDAGPIYAQKVIPIEKEDNYTTLSKKVSSCALALAIEYLPLYFANALKPSEQDEELVSFSPSIKKEEEHLNLYSSCDEFVNQVRSLALTPGGHLNFEGEIIKIYQCSKVDDALQAPIGSIIRAHKKEIILQLAKGRVNLQLLQLPGKKMMKAEDFNNGHKDLEGKILS